jgi:hypothetical protein
MAKFIKVQNFLQAKALLEHDYIVIIGNPLDDMSIFAFILKGETIKAVEYISPYAVILQNCDWAKFENLYYIAKEYDTQMYATMRNW